MSFYGSEYDGSDDDENGLDEFNDECSVYSQQDVTFEDDYLFDENSNNGENNYDSKYFDEDDLSSDYGSSDLEDGIQCDSYSEFADEQFENYWDDQLCSYDDVNSCDELDLDLQLNLDSIDDNQCVSECSDHATVMNGDSYSGDSFTNPLKSRCENSSFDLGEALLDIRNKFRDMSAEFKSLIAVNYLVDQSKVEMSSLVIMAASSSTIYSSEASAILKCDGAGSLYPPVLDELLLVPRCKFCFLLQFLSSCSNFNVTFTTALKKQLLLLHHLFLHSFELGRDPPVVLDVGDSRFGFG
jgi:hypothetical protein